MEASAMTAANPDTLKVLIQFRHGLGDAVQLTMVLRHLCHYHPHWQIDVAALVGKHSAFHGLCRRAFIFDREPVPRHGYDRAYDLDWPECVSCYPGCPSTKAERCLHEVFCLTPLPELCRCQIQVGERALA